MAIIAKLYFEYDGDSRYGCFFREAATGRVLAEAVDGKSGAAIIRIEGREFSVCGTPEVVEKVPVNTVYPPTSPGKKTLGFSIMEHEKKIGCYYGQATTYEKNWIFKKNLVLTVYACFGESYTLYRIGFSGENCHYYRLLDTHMRTVAMLQRHYSETEPARATIYVEEDRYLPLALIVCAGEMLAGVGCGPVSYGPDPSAGNYISIKEPEIKMMDRDFIRRVRALSAWKGEYPCE